MSTTDLSTFSNYLNNGEIYKTYPAACVPDKLKTPEAKKAKLLKFEEIDVDYYEPEARMVGFRTTQDRVRHWIKALNVYFFEYLGDHPENKDKYQIDWTHDPVKWTPSNLKSIAIDVTTKEDKHNPLMYKLTLFLKTGTLQVQGHYYKTFASQHFSVLRDIVHHIVSQQLQDNHDTMQKVSTDMCASDNIDTITINHESDDETDPKTLLGHNNIDVNSNIIDLKQIIPEAKPEAKENTNIVVQSAINTNDTNMMNVAKLDSNSKTSYPQGKNVKESHEYSCKSFESMLKTATNDLENQVTIAIEKLYIQHAHSLNEHLTAVNDTMRTQNDTYVQIKDLLLKSDASSTQQVFSKSQDLSGKLIITEKENAELKFTLQQLRYESLTEIESLKSVINVLKGSMIDIENSSSIVVESLRKSNESMVSRIQARDQQIEALEADVRKHKTDLDKKDEIIYSFKQHNNHEIHNNKDENWTQVQPKNSNSTTETKASQNKPQVLLIGTSNTKGIQPEKFSSSYTLQKREAMTLADTEKTISQIKDPPNVLVLHSLTNDLKESAPVCVSHMKNLISHIHESMPSTSVVVSLATPRADNKKYQTNVELVNAMLKCEYMEDDTVTLCDNGNLSRLGKPVPKFLARDQYHLSKDGIAVLASNLRWTIDSLLDIKQSRRSSFYKHDNGREQGNSNHRDRPPYRRPRK